MALLGDDDCELKDDSRVYQFSYKNFFCKKKHCFVLQFRMFMKSILVMTTKILLLLLLQCLCVFLSFNLCEGGVILLLNGFLYHPHKKKWMLIRQKCKLKRLEYYAIESWNRILCKVIWERYKSLSFQDWKLPLLIWLLYP